MSNPIFHKFFLIITGLFFALMLLETAMWTGGFALSSWQKYKNNRALKNKSQYTVMCIGESTTAQQYPMPLQNILDGKYPDKFSIIDCGRSGTNLTAILESLDDNIKKYRPHIAVCMMGINDELIDIDERPYCSDNIFYTKIKSYKLFMLIKKHIKSLIKNNKAFANTITDPLNDKQLLNKAEHLFRMGDYDKSIKILTDIVKRDPKNEQAYSYIIEIYFHHLPKFKDTAYKMAFKMLSDGSQYDRAGLYLKVILYNLERKNIPLTKKFIHQLLNEKNLEISMSLYGYIRDFLTTEQQAKILTSGQITSSSYNTDKFYGATAIYYMELKDYAKADKYFNMAEEIRLRFPNKQARRLYRLIVQKLIDNNIKVICMQYPVRSIKPLQNILKDTPYYDKITFVSNEEIFKQALREKTYNEIFCDQFGGDFGHCIDGDSLIAENIAKTLIKITKPND